MNDQTKENIKPFLKDLLKMQSAIYLACDASISADVSLKTAKAITLISELSVDNKRLAEENAELVRVSKLKGGDY